MNTMVLMVVVGAFVGLVFWIYTKIEEQKRLQAEELERAEAQETLKKRIHELRFNQLVGTLIKAGHAAEAKFLEEEPSAQYVFYRSMRRGLRIARVDRCINPGKGLYILGLPNGAAVHRRETNFTLVPLDALSPAPVVA